MNHTLSVYKYRIGRALVSITGVRAVFGALAAIFTVSAAAALGRRRERDPEVQAELDRAVAAVDRELAANLELAAIFGQTRQAFVLENGQFAAHAELLAREIPAAHAQAADLYHRIPAAEAAMEKRGPANSLPDADRRVVETWEGDARALQAALRHAAEARPLSALERLIARLGVRLVSH